MNAGYDVLIKRVLDGELSPADLPPALRAEAEQALRWLGAVERAPVALSAAVEARVMARVRRHARSPLSRAWRWLASSRDVDIRLRVRPWVVGLATAAAIALVVLWPAGSVAPSHQPTYVRFVFYAPGARTVAVAGTFNQWDPHASPLALTAAPGVWTTTLALPPGQHQYAFLVDGAHWIADPAAPAVDDGFGRRNSVLAVTGADGKGRAL